MQLADMLQLSLARPSYQTAGQHATARRVRPARAGCKVALPPNPYVGCAGRCTRSSFSPLKSAAGDLQGSGLADDPVPVFIVHHGKRNDPLLKGVDCMKKIAIKIKKQLEQPPHPVRTFVDEPDLKVGAQAPHRLTEALFQCNVATVLFCDDFFSSHSCDKEAKIVAQHGAVNKRFRYLPVFFTSTPEEVAEQASQAWNRTEGAWEKYTKEQIEEFAMALATTTGVRHKDELHDGINASTEVTINRVCQEVRKLLLYPAQVPAPAPAAAASNPKAVIPVPAAGLASAQQGPVGPEAWPVLVAWQAASTMGPTLVVPWLQALSSCVFTITSSSLLLQVGAVTAVTASIAGFIIGSRVAARDGCVTSVVELPPHAISSPGQLLAWAQRLSEQTAAGKWVGHGPVVAACGAGGLVAWCQQGWGVCLPPTAADLPSLVLSGSRVLSTRRQCCGSGEELAALDVRWQGVEGPQPQLLIKQGSELHAVPLPRTAAGALDPAASSAVIKSRLADILTDMFADEGLLLLSASTGQYFSSTPEPVLVLDVDVSTAAELNNMVNDALVLHWLHTLLLQPDSQLRLMWKATEGERAAGSSSSSSRSSSRSSSMKSILAAGVDEFDSQALQQLEQQLWEPDSDLSAVVTVGLKPWLCPDTPPQEGESQQAGSNASQPATGSAAAADGLMAVSLAAVRARAAYALLAVAIQQKQRHVIRWLLARLKQQRAWLEQGHCTAEAVLAAQQRVACLGRLPRFQQPLLLLAAATGDEAIVKELTIWSTHHNLPTSFGQLVPETAALTATSQRQGAPAGGWSILGLACLDEAPMASSDDDWNEVASAPNMLQAASLEELASVLGPEDDLSVAVLAAISPWRLQDVLKCKRHSQEQLDQALELAALLGSSIEVLQLLLHHGADPKARGAAALAWAKQRSSEPELYAALKEALPWSARPTVMFSTSTSSATVSNLAVAAWCFGLHNELAGLGDSYSKRSSLRQFLSGTTDPEGRTVSNLLAQLREQGPYLFFVPGPRSAEEQQQRKQQLQPQRGLQSAVADVLQFIYADRLRGSLDKGAPKGSNTMIAGVQCYISKPLHSDANRCAIILATDILDFKPINARLIADTYADAGYICVIPEYFERKSFIMQLLEFFEALPPQWFFGIIASVLQGVIATLLAIPVLRFELYPWRESLYFAAWVVEGVAAALKADFAVYKVGLQGYCFGGTVGILMASRRPWLGGVLDAVCSADPLNVKLPDVQDIKTPILFICAEKDAQFPEEARKAVQEALPAPEEKSPGGIIMYRGREHGFALRGNKQDPAVGADRADALEQGLRFFDQHLVGSRW